MVYQNASQAFDAQVAGVYDKNTPIEKDVPILSDKTNPQLVNVPKGTTTKTQGGDDAALTSLAQLPDALPQPIAKPPITSVTKKVQRYEPGNPIVYPYQSADFAPTVQSLNQFTLPTDFDIKPGSFALEPAEMVEQFRINRPLQTTETVVDPNTGKTLIFKQDASTGFRYVLQGYPSSAIEKPAHYAKMLMSQDRTIPPNPLNAGNRVNFTRRSALGVVPPFIPKPVERVQ